MSQAHFDNNDNFDLVCHSTGVLAALYLHHDIQGVVDNDNDGFDSSVDCDDNNPDVYPGAMEISDNDIDEDCDGVDNLVLNTNYIVSEVALYPNPTSGFLYVENFEKFNHYEVHDIHGQMIRKGISNRIIDLSALDNDLYLVSFISDEEVITKKIILAK